MKAGPVSRNKRQPTLGLRVHTKAADIIHNSPSPCAASSGPYAGILRGLPSTTIDGGVNPIHLRVVCCVGVYGCGGREPTVVRLQVNKAVSIRRSQGLLLRGPRAMILREH